MVDPLIYSVLVNLGQFAVIFALMKRIGSLIESRDQLRNENEQYRMQGMRMASAGGPGLGLFGLVLIAIVCVGTYLLIR